MRSIKFCLLPLVLFALLMPLRAALADLMISPIRVVFQDRDRSTTVQLLNVTNKTHTYRVNWLIMKMDADGQYKLAPPDTSDPNSVANMVIFSPRQVTIQPHAYQLIRLSLRRPANLPPGEYRAHLAFTRLADFGPNMPSQDPGLQMDLKVNVSFSIPVLVRSGEDKDLKVSFSSPKLGLGGDVAKRHPVLNINLNRDAGSFSSYGSVKVLWKPEQGNERQIGILNNVSLYTELKTRHLVIELTENPTGGTVRIVYTGKYESQGVTWADNSFPIGR